MLSQNGNCCINLDDWIHRILDAAKVLASMNNLKIYYDSNWDAKRTWQQGMACFKYHKRIVSEYIQNLPGYDEVDVGDISKLFRLSLFAITTAQLSLDFDLDNYQPNFLSMDDVGQKMMLEFFPHSAILLEIFCEAGSAIKKSQFDETELTFLAPLIFYSTDCHDLIHPEIVEKIGLNIRHALARYMRKTNVGNEFSERIRKFNELVKYFSSIHTRHEQAMATFATQFPSLVTTDMSHHELFTNQIH